MVLDDPATQKVFCDARRQRILQSIARPASATELAERIGEPVSRLSYHLRLLERHGLIAAVGERRVRSNRETIYGLSAEKFEAAIDGDLAVALELPVKAFSEGRPSFQRVISRSRQASVSGGLEISGAHQGRSETLDRSVCRTG